MSKEVLVQLGEASKDIENELNYQNGVLNTSDYLAHDSLMETFFMEDINHPRERRRSMVQSIIKIFVSNSRTVLFELIPLMMMLRGIGVQEALPSFKAYSVAYLTMNICISLPIKGLNSSLDTLVSNAAGNTRTKGEQIQICGMYLHQSRIFMTIAFLPCLIAFFIVRANWPSIL